ncbi:predicted replication-associated protein [Asterionellopsis glacialis RNA virus]|uniref:Predicted replication-associated protein n=1 Tax=Asterionellopsis glacialis RNA virus TaxID=1522179 RepID=A0A077JBM9_9VIRU|nr:predicted replication-associated protein [Asterionellopsis glacialis RNA virus]BAP16719.1 predicted replication-associated protein [Asterionellopsis glacialis RNA virus]
MFMYSMIMAVLMVLFTASAEALALDNFVVNSLYWELPLYEVIMWISLIHSFILPFTHFRVNTTRKSFPQWIIVFFSLTSAIFNFANIKSMAIMYNMPVILNLLLFWLDIICHFLLDIQSGKGERRDHYAKKQKNKRNAAKKRAMSAQLMQRAKDETKRCSINKKQPKLESQVGKKDFMNLAYDMSDEAVDYVGRIWLYFRSVMEEFQIPSIPWDALTNVKSICEENLPRIVNSELIQKFNFILSLFVAIGWLKRIELSLWGVCVFKTQPLHRTVTLVEVFKEIWSLGQKFMASFLQFVETGDVTVFWNDTPKSEFEDLYTRIVSEWPLIDVGRTGTLDFASFDRELDNCINYSIEQLKTCKDGERTYYSSRLLALRKVAVGRCKQKKGTLREAPFAVLFTGGSSVGKTCIASGIGRYVAGVGGYDNTPENCFSLNEQDKFMSGIATHHTIIRIDDICQTTPDKASENPLEKIIMLCNNQPMPATVAEAEKKGQIMLDPRVVTATTNIADLNAATWVVEPEAIYRRFNMHIEQKVRPEFCKEGTKRLDGSKIAHMAHHTFPDYALFRPYTIVVRPNTSSSKGMDKVTQSFERKYPFGENTWVDIKQLLELLREEATAHFEQQRSFVAGQLANAELPICTSCGAPSELCSCDELDSQVGLPGVALVRDWYLALEERICSQIDIWLYECFMSRPGMLFIGFNYREAINEAVQQYAVNLVIVILMVLFYELNGAKYGAFVLIFAFCVYFSFLYWKVMQMRAEMITRWTTCPRPSVWFGELSWDTKKKFLYTFGGLWLWRILRTAATLYFNTLKIDQSGEDTGTNQGFEKNEKTHQEGETPWWGDVGRIIRESRNKFSIERGEKAATTSVDRMIDVLKKRQCVIEKEDGEFCNIVPLESNLWVLPTHIIPSSPMKATIRRPAGNHCSVMLDPASIVSCKGDLSIWFLPEMGDQKDITGYLPLKIVKGDKNIECKMVFNDGNIVKISEKFLATYGRVVTTRGGFFLGTNYSFPVNTFNGLCMGTLVGLGKKQHIVGFHLAGKNRKGGSGTLLLSDYQAAKEKLMLRPSVLVSHSSTPFETKIQDVDVGPLKAPNEKCVTRSLPLGSKIKVIGAHNKPSSSPSSKVVKSVISDSVTKIMNIEKQHDKPQSMSNIRHKEVDIAGKVDTVFEIDQDRLDRAYVDYATTIIDGLNKKELNQVRIISDDANMSGLDGVLGVNAINFASSRGFPHTGPKTNIVEESDRMVEGISCVRDAPPELWEEVKRLEDILASGKRINTVFKGSLKDEPTKMTKDKVRVFAACNFATILLVRKYYLSLAALVQRNQKLFECAVGVVQQSPEWTDIFKHIGKYGWERGIAGDYAKFDARMSARFMLAAFKILIQVAEKSGNYSDRDLVIMRGLATEITYPTYDYFGTLVQFFGSNPSGHPLTVIINSLVNSLYMRYAYYTIAKEESWWRTPAFREVVSLMTYGDDNIMSVKKGYPGINHTRIAEVFASMGIKYTMADKDAESVPYIDLSTASFLKHFAVWDDELKLYRCPCEEGSIAKMLHAHMQSGVLSMEQSSAEAISNVSLKYFEFGREVYEEKRDQLMQVANESGIMGYVSDLPSYDERLEWYREKFDCA